MKNGRRLIYRTLIFISAAVVQTYSLQSSAEETITVTKGQSPDSEQRNSATKTPAAAMDTPQSFVQISHKQIDQQGAQTLSQALRYSGVQSEERGRATAMDVFTHRGFALDRYLDGLKLPQIGVYGAPQVDTWMVEQATVISGPSSVLYGQASPGGIVNLQSKLPDRAMQQRVVARMGNNQRVQAAFDLGGVMDKSDTILWRLVGNGYKADTQVRYTQEQRYALAPSLTWQPNDATKLTFLANWLHDPDNFHDVIPAQGTVLPNPNGRLPADFFAGEPNFNQYDREQWGVGWMLEHAFNDRVSFRQNARYMHSDFTMDAVMTAGLMPDYRTLARYSFTTHTRGEGVTVDNQLEWWVPGRVLDNRLLTGFDVQWTQAQVSQGAGYAAPITNIFKPVYGTPVRRPAITSDNEQKQEQYGLYLQDSISWHDVTVLAGLRQDWVQGHNKNLFSGKEQSQSDNQLSGRIGGVWRVTETLAPWVSYSTAFQPTAGVDYGNKAFKPRTSEQYEMGIRWQPQPDTELSLSAFEINQQNVLTDDPRHQRFKVQRGEIRSQGVEARLTSQPLDGLSLLANWRYGEAEIREDSNQALVGKTPTGFARTSASVWGDYQLQTGVAAGLGAGLGVRYIGKSPGDVDNNFYVPSYTLVDAALYYQFSQAPLKDVRLSVNANNVLNKTYTASCSGNRRSQWCFAGLERTVIASVEYQW